VKKLYTPRRIGAGCGRKRIAGVAAFAVALIALLVLCADMTLGGERVINVQGRRVVFTPQGKVGCVVAARPGLAAETLGPTLRRFATGGTFSLAGRRRFKIARADDNTPAMIAALRARKDATYIAPLYSVKGRTVAVIPEIAVRLKAGRDRDELDAICKAEGLTVIKKLDFTRRDYLLAPPAKDASDVFDAVDKLSRFPPVERAVPNIAFRPKLLGSTYPNDPYFPNQWHLDNTGQSGGAPDADIDAPEAWEITTGSPDVVVAVIDDGVDTDHPDLIDNLVPGYDFVDDDNDPDASTFWDDAHGTACAGLIAARGNNGLGVSGVAYNCKIMPIRISEGPMFTTDADIATAFRWAATHGADVINNSWGGISAMPLIHDAIRDVTQLGGIGRGGLGCVVLGSSGNDGGPVLWPAAYDEVIAVGATDEFDVVWDYSGSGSQLDLTAPSGDVGLDGLMWTTDLAGSPGYNNRNPAILDYTDSMGGTSGACPVAAGVAALVLSVAPQLTGPQVQDVLQNSADDLGPPGHDYHYGYGRVNARAAVALALERYIAVAYPDGGESFEAGSTVTITWTAVGSAWTPTDKLLIEYSDNAAASWHTIADNIAYDLGTYDWNTTGLTPGSRYLVRITPPPDPAAADSSDATFAVTGPLDHFDFVMHSPQINGDAVNGTCTLTARDADGAPIGTFGSFNTAGRFPVTIAGTGVTVTGLQGAGNELAPPDFIGGVADLTELGMIIAVPATPATIELAASSADGLGHTGTSNPFLVTDGALPRAGTDPLPPDGAPYVSPHTDLSWRTSAIGEGFRLLGCAGAVGPDPYDLVELQAEPAAQIPIGPSSYSPAIDFSPGGVLYGAGTELVTIDPADGSTSLIGTIHSDTEPIIWMQGIAFHPGGALYGVAGTALYSIDPATAFATQIGDIGDFVWGIDFAPDGTLYGTGADLVIIDPGTAGIVSTVGSLPVAGIVDIDFAPDGLIYGVYYAPSSLYRITPSDAAAALIASYATQLWGVASQPLPPSNGEGPATTYDVYFGADNPPSTRICSGLAGPPCDPTPAPGAGLAFNTTYYWQVVATNLVGEMPGPVWQFTTGSSPVLHRFTWDAIPARQGVNLPFPVTVTARDNYGAVMTDFTGTADLSGHVGPLDEAAVGTDTMPSFYPMGTYYEDERTQVIYLADEIGAAGRILSLSLDVETLPTETLHNWTIRMKHTSLDEYPVAPAWESSGWTTVYQRNLETITSTGWVTFVFSTPFEYDGTHNLMIDFTFNNTTWEDDGYCLSSTDGSVRTIYFSSDSDDGDPLTWTGAWPAPDTDIYFPNIKLSVFRGSDVPISPTQSGLFGNGVWTGQITVPQEAAGIFLRAHTHLGYAGNSGRFNVSHIHTLNVQSIPSGVLITGNKPGTTNYEAICEDQEVVTLTAPATAPGPETGPNFIRWAIDGVDQTGDRPIQLTMNTDHTALALYYHWPVTGDATGDCKVDILDMLFVRDRLSRDPATDDNWKADLTQDGEINILDMLLVRNHLNTACQ